MEEVVFVVEQEPAGGYVATATGHAIVTQADSEAELRTMVRDAVQCHFDPDQRPRRIRLQFVRAEVIAAE